jgi:hypothetical protein
MKVESLPEARQLISKSENEALTGHGILLTENMILKVAAHFFRLAGAMIDKVRINQMRRNLRDDRLMWVKRRRRGSRMLALSANFFFRLASNPVSVLDKTKVWRQQEIANFHLLNGKEFLAFSGDEDSVWLECLPGSDLDTLNQEGRLEPGVFYAAGLEFRRVHGLFSPRFRGPWSHGDPNFGNVIFDESTQRVRLIDFETVHIETLSADVRHADDIAVFLLDLIGGVAEENLTAAATAFLEGYNRPDIWELAQSKLVIPNGFGRLWWGIRTEYVPVAILRRRLALLRRCSALKGAVSCLTGAAARELWSGVAE